MTSKQIYAVITGIIVIALAGLGGYIYAQSRNTQTSLPEPTSTENASASKDIMPWAGKWQCSVFGEGLDVSEIELDLHDKSYKVVGLSPFSSKDEGPITSAEPKDGWTELVIPDLNKSPPIGKWVYYNADHGANLGWVSFEGEGSENPCTRVNSKNPQSSDGHVDDLGTTISPIPAKARPQYEQYSIKQLIDIFSDRFEACRAGIYEGDSPQCTTGMHEIVSALHSRGMCWGEGAASEAESSWKKCKSGIWTRQDGYE